MNTIAHNIHDQNFLQFINPNFVVTVFVSFNNFPLVFFLDMKTLYLHIPSLIRVCGYVVSPSVLNLLNVSV